MESNTPQEQKEEVQEKKEQPSAEAEQLLLDLELESLGTNPTLTPQLGNAIGMTQAYDERRRAAEDKVKKLFFKGREDDFKRYLEWKAPSDIEQRENVRRYEESQTRQHWKVQHVLNEQAEDARAKENQITANNATLSEYAEERDSAQRDYEANWDVENKQWLSNKEYADITFATDNGLDEAQAKAAKQQFLEEASLNSKEAFLAIQKRKEERLAAAKKKYDDAMAVNAAKLNEHYGAALKRRAAFYMKSGYDSKMAFTAAVSTIGKDAKAMLVGLIDAGQGAYVQAMLNELSKPNKSTVKIKRMSPGGKPVLGKDGKEIFDCEYDPRLRMCMDTTQIAEVQKYLTQTIQAGINKKNIETNQRNKQLQLVASDVLYRANKLAASPELDMKAMQELYGIAEQLKQADYPQAHSVIKGLNTVVFSAARRAKAEAASQLRFEKLAQKAAMAKLKRDAEKEIMEEVNRLAGLNGRKYKETISETDLDGKTRTAEIELDANQGICMLINEGRMNGLCKGKVWDAIEKRYSKAGENKEIIEKVINNMFMTEQSEYILLDYGTNSRLRPINLLKAKDANDSGKRIATRKDGSFSRARTVPLPFLGRIIQVAQEYLDRDVVAPTEQGLTNFLTENFDAIWDKYSKDNFGLNYMVDVQQRLKQRYQTQSGLVMWDKDGTRRLETIRDTKIGMPDMDVVKTKLPILKKLETERAKNAIISGENIDEEKELNELDSILGTETPYETPSGALDVNEFDTDHI